MGSQLSTVEEVARAILKGGVAIVPTDTVCGLVCRPNDATAIERIYGIKRRPAGMELSLLAATPMAALAYLDEDSRLTGLAQWGWPGALSLIGVRRRGGPACLLPRQGTSLMTRVPNHDGVRELLALTGPLASTSANRHGDPALEVVETVAGILGNEVDAVLRGTGGGGVASTIVDLSGPDITLLREGPLDWQQILEVAGTR